MASKQRSAERESYWRLALEEFRTSGLSVRAFCTREGLSKPSFYAWRRKLQTRDTEASRSNSMPELVPVEVVASPTDNQHAIHSLELTTPTGFSLRFPADIQSEQLAAVLTAIGAAQC